MQGWFSSLRGFFTRNKNLPFLAFAGLYLAIRLTGLYVDVLNPDGINWHERSYFFIKAIKEVKLENTYQEYHPGVTLMAISAPALLAFGFFLRTQGVESSYSPSNYLDYDYVAKIAVVIVGLGLVLWSLHLLKKLVNGKTLLIYAFLVLLEPFYIGQSRLYHLDFLLAHFSLIAFLYLFSCFNKGASKKGFILGALFFSLAVLTKLTALILLPYLFVLFVPSLRKFGRGVWLFGGFVLMVSVLCFVLFPALWVNFQPTLQALYEGAVEVGYSGKHKNLILNALTDEVPLNFYFVNLGFQLSPLALLALLAVCVHVITRFVRAGVRIFTKGWDSYHPELSDLASDRRLYYLSFFAFVYMLVVLSFMGKKLDRYTILFFPYIFIAVAYLVSRFRVKVLGLVLLLYALGMAPQYYRIYPYFYAYANPLFGGVEGKHDVVGVKSFGVAIYEVDRQIQLDRTKYAKPITIVGPKSLSVMAEKAKVFKLKKDCGTCNYMVVYVDDLKDAPDLGYSLMKVVYVDNMDYWYIYKKVPAAAPTTQKQTDVTPVR